MTTHKPDWTSGDWQVEPGNPGYSGDYETPPKLYEPITIQADIEGQKFVILDMYDPAFTSHDDGTKNKGVAFDNAVLMSASKEMFEALIKSRLMLNVFHAYYIGEPSEEFTKLMSIVEPALLKALGKGHDNEAESIDLDRFDFEYFDHGDGGRGVDAGSGDNDSAGSNSEQSGAKLRHLGYSENPFRYPSGEHVHE